MKNTFYHASIWKHVAAFSDLFNDMSVFVYNKERTKAIGKKNVPIFIAPKEKVISTLMVNGKDKPQSDNQLPKISVFWTGIDKDRDRAAGEKVERILLKETVINDAGTPIERNMYLDYKTIPYKLSIEVSLWTKYMDEMTQLLENILPFFATNVPVSLYERAVGIERKVMVNLDSISSNFVADLNEPDRRVIQYNLTFTMEINLYKPLQVEREIRKTNIRIADGYNHHEFAGDVIYSTVMGVSGEVSDKVRQAIIGFDSLKEVEDNPQTTEDETRMPFDFELDQRNARIADLDYYNQLISTLTEGTSSYIIAVAQRDLVQLRLDTDTNTTTSLELSGQGYLDSNVNIGETLAHDYYNIINSDNPNIDSE